MDSGESRLNALRDVSPETCTAETASEIDSSAALHLSRLTLAQLSRLLDPILADADSTARAHPYLTLAVLYAKMRLVAFTADPANDEYVVHLLSAYSSVVQILDRKVAGFIPRRWVATAREAVRIVVGGGASSMYTAAGFLSRAGSLGGANERLAVDETESDGTSATPGRSTPRARPSLHHGVNPTTPMATSGASTPPSVFHVEAPSSSPLDEPMSVPEDSAGEDAVTVRGSSSNMQASTSRQTRVSLAQSSASGLDAQTLSHRHISRQSQPQYVPQPAYIFAVEHSCAQDLLRSKALLCTIRRACEVLAPSRQHIVPLHADLLALYVHTKLYGAAVAFGDEKRSRLEPESTGLVASDVMCVHYYLALAHAATRSYHAAMQHCALALAVPAMSVSDLAVAAYKKYVLFSLLALGKVPPAIKMASYPMGRLRGYAAEYYAFGEAFKGADVGELQKIAASSAEVFDRDANTGLVKQLIRRFPRKDIVRMTSLFVSLSLNDLRSRTGLRSIEETEALILELTEEEGIDACIDSRQSTVRFADKADHAEGFNATQDLTKQLDRALECTSRIRDFKDSILVDPAYASRHALREIQMRDEDDEVCMDDDVDVD